MIKIDSHSFNNLVLEQIDKVKNLFYKITPDNIKYFDETLIRKARGVVNSADEYKYADNSSINSIPCKSINRLCDFMKINKNEYIVLDSMDTIYTMVPEDYTSGSTSFGSLHVEYDVPDGFDGRNSFVKVFRRYRGTPQDVSWGETYWITNSALTPSHKTILSKTKSKISYNSTEILYSSGFNYTYIEYAFLVIVWRKK